MFDLFEPSARRLRDKRVVGYYFQKYGEEAPIVLGQRASDAGLTTRDRRHWRRLARKARQHLGKGIATAPTA